LILKKAFIIILCGLALGATLNRDGTVDISGMNYGLIPSNAPSVGDVLSMGPNGTTWGTLTNFVRVWSGTTGGLLVPSATTNYLSPNNSSGNLSPTDIAGASRVPLTRSTVLQNLYCVVSPAPGSGKSVIITICTNGIDSPLTVAVKNTDTAGSNVAVSVTLFAGTQVGLKIITQSASVPGRVAWSFEGR
jgi:hypothetical protein